MRQPLPEFLAKQTIIVPTVIECKRGASGFELLIYSAFGRYRIYCVGVVDYAIRPHDPRYLMGGPPLQWSVDDPKLLSPVFQQELMFAQMFDDDPLPEPRRYQIITINQTYVIAESFEIEPVPVPQEEQQLQTDYPPDVAQAAQPTPLVPIEWESLEISFDHVAPPERKTGSS